MILIDEAQEMPAMVLSEIRLLSSIAFDSKAILTVVLAGDFRLPERLRAAELAPLESRLRTRLRLEPATSAELVTMIETRCDAAGNGSLMTRELAATLAERSLGNARAMLNVADELLMAAASRDLRTLDEKLYLELYQGFAGFESGPFPRRTVTPRHLVGTPIRFRVPQPRRNGDDVSIAVDRVGTTQNVTTPRAHQFADHDRHQIAWRCSNVQQVRREFALRETRKPLRGIRDTLIAEGYSGIRGRSNYESTLQKRLTNTFYAGRFTWNGVEYKAKHPLIIEPKIFAAVQRTFGNKAAFTKKGGDFGGGWLRCAHPDCGCNIVYDPKVKTSRSGGASRTYHLYRCSNGKRVHKSLKGGYVHQDDIWKQLAPAVDSINLTDELAQQVTDALNETKRKVAAAAKREMESYRDALAALDDREDRLYDDHAEGVLDADSYRRQVDRLKRKRREFTDLLDSANVAITDAGFETVKSTIELAKNAKLLWESRSPLERLGFLEKLLSNRFLDGATVRYDLQKPFATLAEINRKGEWRPVGDLKTGYG